jgi:hypothetical protein
MIFALLLFGCADDGGQCVQLAAPTKHYEAKVLCEADAEMAVHGEIALRADHPTVEARCVPVRSEPNVAMSTGDPAEGQPAATIRLAVAQPRPR